MLADRLGELARELTGAEPTSRTGHELRFRRKGSLSVHLAGPKRGKFFDNEAGAGGDALAMVAHLRGTPMREAYRWALGWLGGAAVSPPPQAPARPERQPERSDAAQKLRQAMRLWGEAVRAAGSPVERYLAGRDLTLPVEAPLRFHPVCPCGADRLPAMVALMTNPETGQPCGVHRTFLLPGGIGKAPGKPKMMLGAAGVVRLVPDDDVASGLGIAEGIETALAIMQRYGWRPVWAAGSAVGIDRFPVLDGIETLTVFPDADDQGASLDAAYQCRERWKAAGREVVIIAPPAGADFGDLAGRGA